MSELKFIITGTAGVGKTTAITTLSDIPPITTDEATTDELSEIKSTTTTAFDFGEILLGDVTVRIYGTPGQERFRHMWEILATGALGLIILVDHSRPDPLKDMEIYLENFASLVKNTGVVVGITRLDASNTNELERYYEALEKKDIFCPVLITDPRDKEDMADLLDTLMTCLEHSS